MTPLNSMPIMLEASPTRFARSSIRSMSNPAGLPSRMNSKGTKVGELPQVSLPGSTSCKSSPYATMGSNATARVIKLRRNIASLLV